MDPITLAQPPQATGLPQLRHSATEETRAQIALLQRRLVRLLSADPGATACAEGAHASRAAPLCVRCHSQLQMDDGSVRRTYCNHPSAPISPVTGLPAALASQQRADAGACGPHALHYSPVPHLVPTSTASLQQRGVRS